MSFEGREAASAMGKAKSEGKAGAAGATGAAGAAAAPATASGPLVDRYSSCVGGRTEIKRIVASEDGGKSMIGQKVSICGWVRTAREAGLSDLVDVESLIG